MSDLISRAVIPTNSLILIEQQGGPILDHLIVYLRASSSYSNPTEKERPHEYITVHKTSSNKAYVKFRRGKTKKEIRLSDIVERLRNEDFHDAWVHNLTLRVKDESNTVWDLDFKNQPLTEGSNAERMVSRYLDSLKDGGWISKVQVRHLPLISVKSVPEGGNMSLHDSTDPSFIAWLGKITNGLIKMKTMRRIDESTYIDIDIKELPMAQ